MKSPRRRYFWPRMTPVLSRASNYSLMVVERKSKSLASLACVARGRIAAWENGSRAGHWKFYGQRNDSAGLGVRRKACGLGNDHSRKVCRGTPVPRRGRPFGRVLLAIQLAR